MGASIVVETEQTLLEIKLNVGMRARNGWVRRVRVFPECHVIFSRESSLGVDNLLKATQVDALLLQAELLLLGRAGDNGNRCVATFDCCRAGMLP